VAIRGLDHGQPTINVPYSSGTHRADIHRYHVADGTYTVTVTPSRRLIREGAARQLSAPSQSLTVNVP